MVVLRCLVVTLFIILAIVLPNHFGYRSSNRVALALVQAFADWDRKLVTRRNSSLRLVRLMYLGASFAAQSNAVTISSRLHYCKTDCARRSDWIDVPWVKSAVLTIGWPLPVYSDNQHHQIGPACRSCVVHRAIEEGPNEVRPQYKKGDP
jgi:hypothetical protein